MCCLYFCFGNTWTTSLRLFLTTFFFLRAHLNNFFETFFDNLFFPPFQGTLEGCLWNLRDFFEVFYYPFWRDLHLRDFWGFALWLDRVIFRVFKDGIMEVGFFTFDFFFIFICGSSIFFSHFRLFFSFFSLLNLLTYFQFHLWELLWFSLVLLTCFPFSFFSKIFNFFFFFF